MEGRRFDQLTRSLASPRTRRGFLGALAALGAGLAGARGADAQVTQAQCGNVICYNRGTQTVDVACNPGCVCCVFGNGNSRCMPPNQCTGTITSPPTTTTTTTAAPTTTTTTTAEPTTTTAEPTTTTTTTQQPTTTTTTAAPTTTSTTTTTTAAPTSTTTTTAGPTSTTTTTAAPTSTTTTTTAPTTTSTTSTTTTTTTAPPSTCERPCGSQCLDGQPLLACCGGVNVCDSSHGCCPSGVCGPPTEAFTCCGTGLCNGVCCPDGSTCVSFIEQCPGF